jgi:hypothetical protein
MRMRPVRARLGPAGLVALATSLSTFASHASGASARLEVARTDSAVGCPDETALRAKIASKLGYDPFGASGARRVRATFDRRGASFEATVEIELGGARRVRTLTSPASDCRELAEATALTIALATDPTLGTEPTTDASPPATASETALASTPTTAASAPPATTSAPSEPPIVPDVRARATAPAREARPGVDGPYLGLSMTTAVASGPTLPLGVGLEFGILARRIGFGIELQGRHGTMAAPTAGRVAVTWGYAAFVPCARFEGWYTCVVLGVGVERVRGEVELPRTATAAYITPGVRFGGELAAGRGVSLFAQVELDASLVRARVVVDGQNVFDPGPVVLVGAVGARVALP